MRCVRLRVGALRRPPALEDPLHLEPHALVCFHAGRAVHEQLVVAGVLVPDGGDYRELDGIRVGGPADGAASDASATAFGGVTGDRRRARRGAAGKQAHDRGREALAQVGVLAEAPLRVALTPSRPRLLVRQALPLGTPERLLLDEDALPLVASPGPAEPYDDGREPARPLGTPGK